VSDNSVIDGLAARQRIRGVLAPVVTPFKSDLSPDGQRLIAHCKGLLSQNCGLAVFGTNSEANSLSMDVLNAVAPVPRFTSRDALS
jgi:dihydrodipicolinate synthase/N-acetylneuraminate lyase